MPKALLLLLLCQSAAAQSVGQVISITDADTLMIAVNDRTVKIQLLGIDAPEDMANPKLSHDMQRTALDAATLMPLGKAATSRLRELVSPGDTVQLKGDLTNRDRYGRTPMLVHLEDGDLLNTRLVSDGYAIVLKRSALDEESREQWSALQSSAVKQQLGLWGRQRDQALKWGAVTP